MNHHLGLSSGVKGQVKGRGTFQIQIPPEPGPPLSLNASEGATRKHWTCKSLMPLALAAWIRAATYTSS